MSEAAPGALDLRDLPELQRARALWAGQQWELAEQAFCQAVEAHPNNWRALIDTARILGDRQEIRRSRALLDRLATLAGDRADLLLQLAQTCRMSRREDEAIALLERYVAGAGRNDPAGRLELAVLHERHHQPEQAEASAKAALRAAPHWLEAVIVQARARRQLGDAAGAEILLRRVVRARGAHPLTQSQAWAMLADLADRAGNPEEAMDCLERAKAPLRSAGAGMAAKAMFALRAWERVAREVPTETLARWNAADDSSPPLAAHLLGFPRSGTTLLENILESHSGLVSSEESQVLGRDLLDILWREPGEGAIPPTLAALDAVSDEKLARLRRRYWDRMAEGLDLAAWPAAHLDKNPTHTLFLPAILRLLPGSRFLVALRDPRDVVVSCYFQWFPLNPNSACFLTWEDTIRRYLLDLGAWLALREKLPARSWLEVRYEDVVADFAAQARRALEFLDLPWEDGVLAYRDRLSAKVVHTPSYLEIQKPVHAGAVARWKKYAPWMEPHLAALRPLVEALGYSW